MAEDAQVGCAATMAKASKIQGKGSAGSPGGGAEGCRGRAAEKSSHWCLLQALLLAPGAARGLLEPRETAGVCLMSGPSLLPDTSPSLPHHKEVCEEAVID